MTKKERKRDYDMGGLLCNASVRNVYFSSSEPTFLLFSSVLPKDVTQGKGIFLQERATREGPELKQTSVGEAES